MCSLVSVFAKLVQYGRENQLTIARVYGYFAAIGEDRQREYRHHNAQRRIHTGRSENIWDWKGLLSILPGATCGMKTDVMKNYTERIVGSGRGRRDVLVHH